MCEVSRGSRKEFINRDESPVRSPSDIFLALITAFLIIFIDQVTKVFFSRFLSVGESLPVIRNIFHMTIVHNTGIAFGLFKEMGAVFIIIPVIAVIFLAYHIYCYRASEEKPDRLYVVAFSMILGGALGNLIDRIRLGYVLDFIDLRIWPVFNIADSAITIGAVIIAIKYIPASRRIR